ncbi:hypothetical protein [Nannocystis bainbridge]|uniref:Uncharacterized protein n=1 Tax=Nannocystis bainbridge TaxID=2995303 RepID=A0ABT5E8Q9_9BACT|nr:hypothetical protein [Nannocystis bainbridge]MDC0721141.1 hypothetical protein [Nannocystis bainbridge]
MPQVSNWPRRIYELVTEGLWYAFVACTPEELKLLEDAGLTPERVPGPT